MEYADGSVGAGRQAIDVGSGGGADALNMLSRGWRVFALDAEPSSRRLLEERTPLHVRDQLEISTGSFHSADLPPADLAYAQFSLPFAGADFEASIRSALASVTQGGAFVGQFFGKIDDWASDPQVASVDRAWIEKMFREFEDLDIDERELDGPYGTENGTKHWHFFHIRARRLLRFCGSSAVDEVDHWLHGSDGINRLRIEVATNLSDAEFAEGNDSVGDLIG
jgi:tellurite methyltransferase